MKKEKNVLLLLTLSSKKCNCCGEIKSTTEFYKQKRCDGKWGFCSSCKKCEAKRVKKYYKENPEKTNKNNAKKNLKRKYGITPEDKENMLKKQNYKCSICGKEIFLFGESKKDMEKIACVDHDHATGEVRGLLCNNCNKGLGNFKDNQEYLSNAISYLKEHS